MGSKSKSLQLLNDVRAKLDAVKARSPSWHADFEDIDPFVASRSDVEHLHTTAPDEFCKGLITGILLMRQTVAAVTNREF
jgi:hypothetical protein